MGKVQRVKGEKPSEADRIIRSANGGAKRDGGWEWGKKPGTKPRGNTCRRKDSVSAGLGKP